MLKLKLMTAILAVAGLVMFLMGSTYLTTSCSVICTAAALSLSLHLVFRWLTGEQYDYLLWFFLAGAYIISGSMAISVLQDVGAVDTALSAVIDPVQKIETVGYYTSSLNSIAIILAAIVPRSPMRDDDDEG
jgi:lipoprotein